MTEHTRRCKKCNADLPIECFYIVQNWRRHECKSCVSQRTAKRQALIRKDVPISRARSVDDGHTSETENEALLIAEMTKKLIYKPLSAYLSAS